MKSTGVSRKVDELGRIVLPVEIRRALVLNAGDPLEIHVDGDRIVLSRPGDRCVFCGGADDLCTYRERQVCGPCLRELADTPRP